MAEALPRSLDVVVNITKAQTEIATDMSLSCLVVQAADWPYGDSDTVKFYSTSESALADFPNTTDAYWSLLAFFSQSPRPASIAVGKYSGADLAEAAAAIQAAAVAAGRPIYGWLLDASYRDIGSTGADLEGFCEWVEAQDRAIAFIETNDAAAYNSGSTTDIGAFCHDNGFTKVAVFYHDNAQECLDAAAMAIMLAVDYAAADSTITLKFKDALGIETVAITETQLSVLQSKRINTFTAIGNNSRTIRDGVMSSDSWFCDDRVNIDNFVEELQVAVFNVFLQKKKVPYTAAGQLMLIGAMSQVSQNYVTNGSFADRQVADTSQKAGFRVEKAYVINPTPVYNATASDRANRVAPPIQETVYLAGAMHKVTINVDVVS